MLLLHIAYSEEDAAARIQFAFGHPYPAACLYIFEIHRKKSHPMWYFPISKGSGLNGAVLNESSESMQARKAVLPSGSGTPAHDP